MLELLLNNLESSVIVTNILSCLTNLALNDQINYKIRIHGAHIIGRILMTNCPALTKDLQMVPQNTKLIKDMQTYSED
jgi:hypothetical protein